MNWGNPSSAASRCVCFYWCSGKCSPQRDYVIRAVRTPPKEQQQQEESVGPPRLASLDEEWITTHASQVRAHPGSWQRAGRNRREMRWAQRISALVSSQALFAKWQSLPHHTGHRCFKPGIALLFSGFLMNGHLILLKGKHLQDVFLHGEGSVSENQPPWVHFCSWCRLVSPVVFHILSYMVSRLPILLINVHVHFQGVQNAPWRVAGSWGVYDCNSRAGKGCSECFAQGKRGSCWKDSNVFSSVCEEFLSLAWLKDNCFVALFHKPCALMCGFEAGTCFL